MREPTVTGGPRAQGLEALCPCKLVGGEQAVRLANNTCEQLVDASEAAWWAPTALANSWLASLRLQEGGQQYLRTAGGRREAPYGGADQQRLRTTGDVRRTHPRAPWERG